MQSTAQGELSKSASSPLSSLYQYHYVTSAACLFSRSASASFAPHKPSSTHSSLSSSRCPPPFSLFSYKPHPLPLPTWPSAVQLDASVAGCMDALWLPSTNCSLTLLPLCLFSCSLSHLLSPSLSSSPCILCTPFFCFHSDYLPISSSLPLLCLSPPSLSRRRCSCRLTLHPSLPTNTPSLLLFLLEIFKADQHTLAHSITHSSPAWEKHVSYSGSGPDCMLWEWSGEWQMGLACLDTPDLVFAAEGSS